MARHRLANELAGAIPPGLLADVVAVIAELVGNSIRHAEPLPGEVIRVAWRHRPEVDADVVIVRVTDGGSAVPPRARDVGPEALDGRGLHIVAALTEQWGVDRDGLGQSVWAELRARRAGPLDLDAEAAPAGLLTAS